MDRHAPRPVRNKRSISSERSVVHLAATAHLLITLFPADAVTADTELTAIAAAAELMRGSLEEGAR